MSADDRHRLSDEEREALQATWDFGPFGTLAGQFAAVESILAARAQAGDCERCDSRHPEDGCADVGCVHNCESILAARAQADPAPVRETREQRCWRGECRESCYYPDCCSEAMYRIAAKP